MDLILIIILGVVAAIVLVILVVWILKRMKGNIELRLNSYTFSPGQKVSGNILLKLKKPINKGQLFVQLIGERWQTSYSGKGTSSRAYRVFDFEYPISEERSMPIGEFNIPFEFAIPNNLLTQPKFGGSVAGTLVKSAQILMGQNVNIRWWLVGKLKCEGLNLNKKVRVNVA